MQIWFNVTGSWADPEKKKSARLELKDYYEPGADRLNSK